MKRMSFVALAMLLNFACGETPVQKESGSQKETPTHTVDDLCKKQNDFMGSLLQNLPAEKQQEVFAQMLSANEFAKKKSLATCKAKNIILYRNLDVVEQEDGAIESNFTGELQKFSTQLDVRSIDDFQYQPYHGPVAGIKVTTTEGLKGWLDPYASNCCHLDPMKCKAEDMSAETEMPVESVKKLSYTLDETLNYELLDCQQEYQETVSKKGDVYWESFSNCLMKSLNSFDMKKVNTKDMSSLTAALSAVLDRDYEKCISNAQNASTGKQKPKDSTNINKTKEVEATVPKQFEVEGVPNIDPKMVAADAYKKSFNLNNKGMKYYKKKNYKKAIDSFVKSLEAYPGNFLVRFNLACTFSLNGDRDKALGMLKQLKSVENCMPCRERLLRSQKDKDFKSLWDDKEYKSLLADVRIQAPDYKKHAKKVIDDLGNAKWEGLFAGVQANHPILITSKDKNVGLYPNGILMKSKKEVETFAAELEKKYVGSIGIDPGAGEHKYSLKCNRLGCCTIKVKNPPYDYGQDFKAGALAKVCFFATATEQVYVNYLDITYSEYDKDYQDHLRSMEE